MEAKRQVTGVTQAENVKAVQINREGDATAPVVGERRSSFVHQPGTEIASDLHNWKRRHSQHPLTTCGDQFPKDTLTDRFMAMFYPQTDVAEER